MLALVTIMTKMQQTKYGINYPSPYTDVIYNNQCIKQENVLLPVTTTEALRTKQFERRHTKENAHAVSNMP